MAGSAAHKPLVLFLGLVAVLLGAAAGIVAALQVKAAWAVVLAIAAIIVGAFAGIVERIVVPGADARRQAQGEYDQARAIGLMLMRDGTRVSLAATNQTRYEVSSVQVDCWPGARPDGGPHQLPRFAADPWFEVSSASIGGGGQSITVTSIPPSPIPDSGAGPTLGAWTAPPLSTPVVFEVDWLDHKRKARRLVGRADLCDPLPIAIVDLSPPQPTTTPPSWRARIRHRLMSG